MLIREFVQNPAFDVNCYIKIFDSTKEAGWEGKIPVYDGYGSPVDTSEDILSMERSYVTTNQHEIILEGIHRDGVAQKEEPDVTRQGWFMQAKTRMENIHFSTPHVQNLFDDGTCRYYWVISLSRAVELTTNGSAKLGVLLVFFCFARTRTVFPELRCFRVGLKLAVISSAVPCASAERVALTVRMAVSNCC